MSSRREKQVQTLSASDETMSEEQFAELFNEPQSRMTVQSLCSPLVTNSNPVLDSNLGTVLQFHLKMRYRFAR
jgi:hypothetical protein